MANQYKNKVIYNGTTLIDLSDTTAVQSDVASGKYFYVASGQRVQGTGQGGIVTEVIFPEQSVTATTADSTGYTVNINVSESLIDGANYMVTMDGTSYLCYANNKYGGTDIYMGDDNNIWGNLSQAQYPFCVATWSNGTTAWGVPDTTAHTVKIEKVLSYDTAELTTKTITANGTYSASSDSVDGYSEIVVNVSGGSTGTWETKTDQGVTIIADNPNYFLWTYTEALDDDETFRITWGENGTQYICETSVDPSGSTADGYYLGNASLVNIGDDTGEPFLIYKRTATEMGCVTNREAGSWHIKIEKQVSGSSGGITPTGTVSITTNGTYDVTNYASAVVNIPSGASNIVTGTFKGTTTGAAMDVDLAYAGNGYPLNVMIYPKEGAYDANSTIYTLLQRYCTILYVAIKDYVSTAPDYNGTGTDDEYTTINRYKNSTTNYTAYGQNVSVNNPIANGSAALTAGSGKYVVAFKAKNKMSVYIANTSYGFPANIEFKYQIIYSS